MLRLCAVARKFVMKGRFSMDTFPREFLCWPRAETWIKNSGFDGNADLSSYRQQMDTYLEWLQSATTFAILDNTENMLEQQAQTTYNLAILQSELSCNRESQEQIAISQHAATEEIGKNVLAMAEDIKKLLALQQEVKSVKV